MSNDHSGGTVPATGRLFSSGHSRLAALAVMRRTATAERRGHGLAGIAFLCLALTGLAATPAFAGDALGKPTISGVARVGQTLTANTDGITDADGLTGVSYEYLWQRPSLNSETDREIGSARTYTVKSSDLGHQIRVFVIFYDDNGEKEVLGSVRTSGVVAALPTPPSSTPPSSTSPPPPSSTPPPSSPPSQQPPLSEQPPVNRNLALNFGPDFISSGLVIVAENGTLVLTVTAVDRDVQDDAVRYGIDPGSDASAFYIDPATGELRFVFPPDFETPSDADRNNVYDVTVIATSGVAGRERTADQRIEVTVTDVDEIQQTPGAPVTHSGLYQQETTLVSVTNSATRSDSVIVKLPDNPEGDTGPLHQVNIEISDVPAGSVPDPDRSIFVFSPSTLVDVKVSPVPTEGVEVCLLIPAEQRAEFSGSQPQILHLTASRIWERLESSVRGGEVCARAKNFSPFMVGYRLPSLTAASQQQVSRAWLPRFGRTVTGQVLDVVSGRLSAPRSPGLQMRLAGRALQSGAALGERTTAGQATSLFRSLTPRDLLTGTSFSLSDNPTGDSGAVWGRGALTRFDGGEGALSLDGETATVLLGRDRSWRRWTSGLALGHSRIKGSYRTSAETGEVEARLTGLYPYAGLSLNDHLSGWMAAGYGAGNLMLRPQNADKIRTDLSLMMGAAGMRSEVLSPPEPGGLSLAVKGDARFTRTRSDVAEDADVWLVRAGVEGSRRFTPNDSGATMMPSFELGVRFDGGDAEVGVGAYIGGGIALTDTAHGLTMDLKARGLASHEDEDFREWGVSASLGWEPRPETEQGLSVSLRQSWGGPLSGGMDTLFDRETLTGLAVNDSASRARLGVELGYGIAIFDGGFTATPNVGFALSETGRDFRIGWRVTPIWRSIPGFRVNLYATRSEADGKAPSHVVMLRSGIRF